RPALTSFTRSAPASSAAAATSAFVVSTASGTRTAARIARSTGTSRRRSSAAGTGAAPGRADSAPPSRSAAPPAPIRAAAAAAPVDDLALEQRLGHLVQDLGVPAEEELGPLVRLEDDAADLVVDLHGRGLGVLRPLREVPPEEDLLLLLAVGDRPELLAHAPLAHHLPRQLGGALEIVAGAGGHVAEHELLGGATAEEDREVVQEEAPRVGVAVVERDLLRQAEG